MLERHMIVRIPPEINSGRMFAGAGATATDRAASAWDQLSAKLSATSKYCRAATLKLNEGWKGSVAVAVMRTMTRYIARLDTAADQAARAASNAREAARARESLIAALVGPEAIAVNRAQLVVLALTNWLGQFSPAIAETEAEYERMWVADADAVYDYARASADATALAPTGLPFGFGIDGVAAPITHPAVPSGSWWAAAPGFVSATQDVIAAIPKALQALSLPPRTTLDVELLPATPALSMLSSLSPPSSVAIRNLNSMYKTTMLLAMPASVAAPRLGSAMSVGSLTVPQRWVAQTAASEITEIPSEWIWEPMRLVHTASRHGDDS